MLDPYLGSRYKGWYLRTDGENHFLSLVLPTGGQRCVWDLKTDVGWLTGGPDFGHS